MGSENKAGTQKEKQKKSVGGIIVNIVIGIILVLVFIITLNIIISSVTGKGYNAMFGSAFLAVKTESMSAKSGYEPAEGAPAGFEKGDLIIVKEKNDSMTFEVGDIITFYAERSGETEILTHRITRVNTNNSGEYIFFTKGDTGYNEATKTYYINEAVDNKDNVYLNYEDVIGKYTGTKIPGIGHIGMFIETAYGYWLIIGVPALLILIYCIISFVLAVTKRNRVELAGEKEKIRLQILNEMRAEQGLPPLNAMPAPAATGVTTPASAPDVSAMAAPAAPIAEPAAPAAAKTTVSVAVKTAAPASAAKPAASAVKPSTHEEVLIPAAESAAEVTDDGIPVTSEEDMDAAIERIRGELAANFGDPETASEDGAAAAKTPAAPAAAAKKPAAKSTASKTSTTKSSAAKTATGKSAAAKPASAKTAASASAKKPASETAKKTTTAKSASTAKSGAAKSTAASKNGLIGTGSKKTTTSKKKTDE